MMYFIPKVLPYYEAATTEKYISYKKSTYYVLKILNNTKTNLNIFSNNQSYTNTIIIFTINICYTFFFS